MYDYQGLVRRKSELHNSIFYKVCVIFAFVIFPLIFVLAWPIAFGYKYEKAVWKKLPSITAKEIEECKTVEEVFGKQYIYYNGKYDGYKASDASFEMTLNSKEDFEQYDSSNPISLRVNKKDLKPTGVYKELVSLSSSSSAGRHLSYKYPTSSTTYTNSSTPLILTNPIKVFLKRSKAIYAQYYSLQLKDGSNVILLINDAMLDLYENGEIVLPLSSKGYVNAQLNSSQEKILHNKGIDEAEAYIDVAGGLAFSISGEMLRDAYEGRSTISVICFLGSIVGELLCLIILYLGK